MREILFRGKRHDGEWVYGDLSKHKNGKKFIKCGSATHSHEVIPETVGQYTGVTDKNGTKIFEGDIIYREYNLICGESKITREKQIGVAIFHIAEFRAKVIKGRNTWFGLQHIWKGDFIEVIGNIHDNPELLKGGE